MSTIVSPLCGFYYTRSTENQSTYCCQVIIIIILHQLCVSADSSWSSIAASEQASASPDSIPAWVRTQPQPRPAGRGGLRAPATQPKVYAGAMNPPAPGRAPMPPPAWQQQVWQAGRGVASQMNSLNLNG